MRWVLMVAVGVGVAGCAVKPTVMYRSETAIAVAGSPEHRQEIEDMAGDYCRRKGLTARLKLVGNYLAPPLGVVVPSYRFECETPPAAR